MFRITRLDRWAAPLSISSFQSLLGKTLAMIVAGRDKKQPSTGTPCR
jgi:hypothetical protein